MSNQKQIAVVTGAARGIGRALTLAFAGAGYEVFALARSVGAVEALKQEAADGAIHAVPFDALDESSVLAACERIKAAGTARVLVNNAGIALAAPLSKTSGDEFDRTLTVNLRTPFLLCRELMPGMAKAGGGRVINIASTAALKGFKYTSAYCASKHALLGLTRSLAVEYAAKAVTVNALCPGWTDTDMLAQSAENISKATGRSTEEARDSLAKMNPMGQLIRPEDVARLCLFLASEAASAVTGAAWTIDGGESA
jgi:NAD(P)-dependent dehydrogenase (short-subunit alcohol dehydrogenase family)